MQVGGRQVGGKNFGTEKRLKKPKTLGRGGCVFGSSPKQLQRPHPQLVHWWLLVHSSPWCCDFLTLRISLIFYSPSRGSSGKKKEPPLLGIPLIFKNVWAGPEVNSHLSEFLKMKKNGCRWATFKYLCTCVPVFGGYLVWGVGQSDPAPTQVHPNYWIYCRH